MIRRRAGRRASEGPNALGTRIEQRFADPYSLVHSYSELERRSGISREAISRYVSTREDRRRSPTVDTLALIADALRLTVEDLSLAAAATARGVALPSETETKARETIAAPLLSALSDGQFAAVLEILRQMQPSAS